MSAQLFLLSILCAHAVFSKETACRAALRRLADSTPAAATVVAVAREMAGAARKQEPCADEVSARRQAEPGVDHYIAPPLAAVAWSPRTAPHINSTATRHSVEALPQPPSAAPADPWGQRAEWEAANSVCRARACNNEAKDLVATTDTVQGHLQQSSQLRAEPAQDAFSHAEGAAQAAPSADIAPECLTPEAAEQRLLLGSAPLSPLPEAAQEAPATTLGLQDMMALLLPPASHAAGQDAPSQELLWPRNASGAVQTDPAAADARQSGAEQQLGELPAHSLPRKSQKPRPQPRARQAEAFTAAPSSSVPAAMPGDELSPEEECFICLDAQRCVLLAPCGHMPYCVQCAEQLCGPKGTHAVDKGQVCPVCREAVHATVYKAFY